MKAATKNVVQYDFTVQGVDQAAAISEARDLFYDLPGAGAYKVFESRAIGPREVRTETTLILIPEWNVRITAEASE